jgi:hypothetical protein
LGLLGATVKLGNDLIAPGEKEIVTFKVGMPDGYGEEFSLEAHEFFVGCELWLGRNDDAERIALLPRYNAAAP